jgi:phosphatidylserine/phosphatidylglycerophosphate/cardiolipin synthase-like enzyme
MTTEQKQTDWWVQGDFPVRRDSRVAFLIDGRHTMQQMCLRYLTAKKSIYLANWGLSPNMVLVRGSDQQEGPEGSAEQEALVEHLRARGLTEQDIAFWKTNELTLQNVLGYAVSKGLDVKVLLWACPEAFSHYSPKSAHSALVSIGVNCILDDSASRLPHLSESLHQKISIVDGEYAFVGGIDPLVELSGDFDRWDTPWHNFASLLRKNPKDPVPHTWHDAHSLITGSAAGDVAYNFYERWNDVVNRHKLPANNLVDEPGRGEEGAETGSQVQIVRTIPAETYSFTPRNGRDGIHDIAQSYALALAKVQKFLYIENQYFWLHTFLGLDVGEFGPDNAEMEHNLALLASALERGATLALVLPDHPNVGREFTDKGLEHLRKKAPNAAAAGRIQVFTLACSGMPNGKVEYRPIYVHAKVAVIDDMWSTIGSANLNNRGMRDDAEMNMAVLDAEMARNLRVLLWAEHLGQVNDEEHLQLSRHLTQQHLVPGSSSLELWDRLVEQLDDPLGSLPLLVKCAAENLAHFRASEPLVGHIFPYLTGPEAKHLRLRFHESHGLFETPVK